VLARFRRQGHAQGWVAIAPMGNRARVACVVATDSGRPRVQWTLETAWDQPLAALRELKSRLGRGGATPGCVVPKTAPYSLTVW